LPGQPAYAQAQITAMQRLEIFHTGLNAAVPQTGPAYSAYADPGQTSDILDPAVVADPVCHPIPTGNSVLNDTPLAEHPDWVITDLTQPPGPYVPRQPAWLPVLVGGQQPTESTGCGTIAGADSAFQDELQAIQLVQTAALDQVRTYATTAIPYGLWEEQPGCDYSKEPTVQSFAGAQQPHWMQVANPAPNAPVYSETPGAAVFKMICINCHGPDAAADGRLAQNLATMTGGNAIVADWRDGILGPVGATEAASNREAVFGNAALQAAVSGLTTSAGVGVVPPDWLLAPDGTALTADDRAARYMAWMGLGGTGVNIPLAVLQIVSITDVLGARRTLSSQSLSANMLSEAKALCLGILGPPSATTSPSFQVGEGHGYLDAALTNLNKTLLPQNGDAEMWLTLCSLGNPPPIHVLSFGTGSTTSLPVPAIDNDEGQLGIQSNSLVAQGTNNYPPGAPVGNATGGIDSTLQSTNTWPWCIDPTAAPTGGFNVAQSAAISSQTVPVCPTSVVEIAHTCGVGRDAGVECFLNDEANGWAVRGAINAGMSVFLYGEWMEANGGPAPDYNQCPN
jgi:mono/diheme cytochrome c family protein